MQVNQDNNSLENFKGSLSALKTEVENILENIGKALEEANRLNLPKEITSNLESAYYEGAIALQAITTSLESFKSK